MVIGYIALLFVLSFIIQTILRELGVRENYRPFYIIYYIGTIFQKVYYYVGLMLGHIYSIVFNILVFIKNRCLIAIYDTIIELINSFKPYFNFGKIYDGLIYAIRQIWDTSFNITHIFILINLSFMCFLYYSDTEIRYVAIIMLCSIVIEYGSYLMYQIRSKVNNDDNDDDQDQEDNINNVVNYVLNDLLSENQRMILRSRSNNQ